MSNEQGNQPPERTIDRMHRETGTPMRALEVAFDLLERGMLDEDTIAGSKVVVHAAQVIAERSIDAATRMRDLCVEETRKMMRDCLWNANGYHAAAANLLIRLRSLTLDNGEQEQK